MVFNFLAILVNIIIAATIQVIAYLIMPNPKADRPNHSTDFDGPTNEDGRSVPVVFGTVTVKGLEVLWTGEKQTFTYTVQDSPIDNYFLSAHFGICIGPVDAILGVYIGEKTVFEANITQDIGCIQVDLSQIFGGERKEGGVRGTIWFMRGTDTQTLPNVIAKRMGLTPETCPAYRGIASFALVGLWDTDPAGRAETASFYLSNERTQPGVAPGVPYTKFQGAINAHADWRFPSWYWSSNSPYLKTVWAKVRRTPHTSLNSAYARIRDDANGVHIIWEAMTNPDWGIGLSESFFEKSVWEAAAKAIFDEDFGLSLLWSRQTEIENFVADMLDHLRATIYINRATGKFEIRLLRGDYRISDLQLLDESNCTVTSFARKGFNSTINEVQLTYTNPVNESDVTIKLQDPANVQMQGGEIVTDTRNLYGIRRGDIAAKVLREILNSVSTPLAAAEIEANRTTWERVPGDVIRLTYAEHQVIDLPMRITKIDYGQRTDDSIKISVIEDIFGLDANVNLPGGEVQPGKQNGYGLNYGMSYGSGQNADTGSGDTGGVVITPPSGGTSTAPSNVDYFQSMTLPYAMGVKAGVAFDGARVAAMLLVNDTAPDAFSYDCLASDALGNYNSIGNRNIIGRDKLLSPLKQEPSTVCSLPHGTNGTLPVVGGYVVIGGPYEPLMEIAFISAIDAGGNFTLQRGALDTAPMAFPAGTPVWFIQLNSPYYDPNLRTKGAAQQYKFLTRTTQGVLDPALATIFTAVPSDRAYRPLRPANVRVNNQKIGSNIQSTSTFTCTWARRNRLTEDAATPLFWEAADVVPEPGQTTLVKVMDLNNNVLDQYVAAEDTTSISGLTRFSIFRSVVKIRVTSLRGGVESFQGAEILVTAA